MSDLMAATRAELRNIATDILSDYYSADDLTDFMTRNIEWILQEADPDLVDRLRKALK